MGKKGQWVHIDSMNLPERRWENSAASRGFGSISLALLTGFRERGGTAAWQGRMGKVPPGGGASLTNAACHGGQGHEQKRMGNFGAWNG